jgi:sulfur carrier protein
MSAQFFVNGEPRAHVSGTTVADVVASLNASGDGCAVALNDAVVPRSNWTTRAVEAGDRVEVLIAAQGG